jgi:hypothetical protein
MADAKMRQNLKLAKVLHHNSRNDHYRQAYCIKNEEEKWIYERRAAKRAAFKLEAD